MAARIIECRKVASERLLDVSRPSPEAALYRMYEQARREVLTALPWDSTATGVVTVEFSVIVDG